MNSIRRFLCLVICLLIYFGEGINTSLMAPLFPPYAKNLGLNPTQIGLVQSMFNISIFFSQFLVASLVVPDTRKLYHVLGIFVSAVLVQFIQSLRVTNFTSEKGCQSDEPES